MITDLNRLIRDRRKELKLTLVEVADRLNITPSTVSKWERGEISNLKREKVLELAKVLNIHPARLFGYSQVEVDNLTAKQQIRLAKIPVYSLETGDVFSEDNITRFIGTDNLEAQYAVTATGNVPQGENITDGDILLLRRDFEAVNNILVLVISDINNYIARYYVTDGQRMLLVGSRLVPFSDNLILAGKVIEIRRCLK